MDVVVAPPLPFDWDALRSPAWHERRARKRAVRAEFAQAREVGLRRRHAVKLARVHAACTVDAHGRVRCAVDSAGAGRCPCRFALIDPLDRPGVTESPTSNGVLEGSDVVEELSHDELLVRVGSTARRARSARLPTPPAPTPATVLSPPTQRAERPTVTALSAEAARHSEAVRPRETAWRSEAVRPRETARPAEKGVCAEVSCSLWRSRDDSLIDRSRGAAQSSLAAATRRTTARSTTSAPPPNAASPTSRNWKVLKTGYRALMTEFRELLRTVT
jgi:hypothetical protein